MRRIAAYQSEDGSIHATAEAAQRIDDASTVKPLLDKLDRCFARASDTKQDRAFGLLAFIRENWAAIEVFRP